MTWRRRFRLRQRLKSSLWVIPLAGAVLGALLSLAAVEIEDQFGFPEQLDYSSSAGLSILTTIVGATVGLFGFVVTVTVLVVQMSTGTFSARYMRLWYRDRTLKAVLAALLCTLTLSFTLLRHIGESVPNLGIMLAGFSLGTGLVLFLVFLDRVMHRLRPVAVASLVARAGRQALRDAVAFVSPPRGDETDRDLAALQAHAPALTLRTRRPGAIQAFDGQGLVRWAIRHDAVIVWRRAAGDFVSEGSGILDVYCDPAPPRIAEHRLRGMVALGTERTIEQDPAFALRNLVDNAERALSPAVNDPTTAVQVLDHLEDTLAVIGTTPGAVGRWEYRDEDGQLRRVAPAHRWDDFLALGVTEIRQYGAESIQVVRRLRAMLEALRETVLPEYAAPVDAELARLAETVEAAFGRTPDAAEARLGDRQGIGGPTALV